MSGNLGLVRSLFADWERGIFFAHAEWAHPEIECVVVDGPTPGSGTGVGSTATVWREVIAPYQEFRATPEEYREIDKHSVLVLVRFSGRGKTSSLDIEQLLSKNACVLDIDDGRVKKLVMYWDRDRALADLGLEK